MSAENICQEDWKKKMMSEKIAFLSVEIDITPEEAQTFWPIYNQVNQERDEAMFKVFKAYKELDKAVSEGKGAKEISDLLETYLDAQEAQRELEGRVAERYGKALPMEKVAKAMLPFYLCMIAALLLITFFPSISLLIPKLLGGGQYVLVGNIIETQFLTAGDWNFGSAISLIMALIIMFSMWLTNKVDVQPATSGKE